MRIQYSNWFFKRQNSKQKFRLELDPLRSNHTTRICWRFAVDLLADRLYSKSPASLQQIYSKSTAFCHQRICLQHLDVSICCRQMLCRQQIRSIWFRTDKSTASLQQIRCVASKSTANRQQVASKSTANPCSMVWAIVRVTTISPSRGRV